MDKALAAILEKLGETALDCGFSRTGFFDTAAVRVHKEVRDACAEDKCRSYGKNWSCPPGCGSLEECEMRIRRFPAGLLLQTSGTLEDSFDYESMERIGTEHNDRLRIFLEKTGLILPDAGRSALLLGSGGCRYCERCTCPDLPCAFPEKMIVSMEACGITVSELCETSNIPYYYGPNILTYTGCMFIK